MKPFVLVVDDSISIRMDLRRQFTAANFLVAACGTLVTARELLRKRSVDLAVLDLVLPDGSGADLLAEMRRDLQLRHIPVIVLSMMVDARVKQQVCAWPGAEYVSKPYKPEHLVGLAVSLCKTSMAGKRVLIVDDSPTFGAALARQLRQYGSLVQIIPAGEQALELLQRETIDCVVIDMVMPGIGGLATCQRLRALPGGRNIPVVMLTAGENLSGRSQGLALGADLFLLKSPRLDLICAQIYDLLRRKQTVSPRPPDVPGGPVQEPPAPLSLPVMYDQILPLLGLSVGIARVVMARACHRAGLTPEALTTVELPKLLPSLRDMLQLFMPLDQLVRRVAAIQLLADCAAAKCG